VSNTLNNSINTVNLNSKFMNKYFKSDIVDSLDVLQQEREEELLETLLYFYVKYYHAYTRGYWHISTEFVINYYYYNSRIGFRDVNDPNVFYSANCPELGYKAANSASLDQNLYEDWNFCWHYMQENPGKVVFVRSNNYKELVDPNVYNYRVKFFDEEGNRIKELHAFATKDYCVSAFKKWHSESFDVVDLSAYKFIYVVEYQQMNDAVEYGYNVIKVVPFDPLIHVNSFIDSYRPVSYIRDEGYEPYTDLSNKWQVIATNEPIYSISVDKNDK